jgi:hypothetical protein
MIAIATIEETIEKLEELKRAIVSMKPSRREAEKINAVYNALKNAQNELQNLTGE